MSTLKLQERFTLGSPPERVWAHLIDPERTVECLPGAELEGQEDERTWAGSVKVKVGAVTVAYRGTVVFEEVDEEQRIVRMVGKGRERSGSGTAQMTMESRVLALDDGGSEVTVDAEVRVTGRIVRFGRGMIETVSAELFKDFRARLAEALRAEEDGGADAAELPVAMGRSKAGPGAAGAREDDAIALLPLLWRAFRTWLRRLFGRG